MPLPVLAASGWQWGRFPSPTGLELGQDRYAAAVGNTHVLSQNWAVAVWEHGAAYLPRQDDAFFREGMLMMCSTDLDVYLLYWSSSAVCGCGSCPGGWPTPLRRCVQHDRGPTSRATGW